MTSAQAELSLRSIAAALSAYTYRFGSEVELHAGIAQALDVAGFNYTREYRASAQHRFDFWVPGSSIAIEVKVRGSMPAAFRQIDEYLQLDTCQAVVLAAAKNWASTLQREYRIRGKSVRVVRLHPQAF